MLTIPAAGSESSGGSVITNEDELVKESSNSVHESEIRNNELSPISHCPLADGGSGRYASHVWRGRYHKCEERGFHGQIPGSGVTQEYNDQETLKGPRKSLRITMRERRRAGTIAHNDLLSTGRIGDWLPRHVI